MSNAVDTLQAVFENSECKLNLVICEIERCFAAYDSHQAVFSANDSSHSLNPVRLLEEMKEISEELVVVKEDYGKLKDYEAKTNMQVEEKLLTVQTEVQTILQTLRN